MYLILQYTITSIYLLSFFYVLGARYLYFFKRREEVKTKIYKNKSNFLNLFMEWAMFENIYPSKDVIKIIVENKSNNIDIYYFIDDNLKKIIPELDIHQSCYAPLIFKYSRNHFLTNFIAKALEKKYNNNLKYITFYKITYIKIMDSQKMEASKVTKYYQYIYG
jgi:hypothetical protein